jgi:signal transduction histidine kinase
MMGVNRASATAGRWLDRTPEWPLAVGAGLGLLALTEVSVASLATGQRIGLQLALALFATVPAAAVRVYLLAATAVATAGQMLTLASGFPPTVASLGAQVLLFYLVGRRHLVGRPGTRWMSLALVLPYLAVAVTPFGWAGRHRSLAVLLLAFAVAPMMAGGVRWARGEVARRDASRQALADTMIEHVVRGERARIARELHDVVAHHISMIAVQAETARLATPGLPDEGADRLRAIGDTARTALTEMRRLLSVLREDAGTPSARIPQPGLEQLNELIDEARASTGASTRLILQGQVVPLDPGVQLTAYRIIQEALTNARRHAPGAAVDVELAYTPGALRLRVRDSGPGPAAETAGHGLLGMRERVAMMGGQLRAGPAPAAGFLVEAVLPTPREAP